MKLWLSSLLLLSQSLFAELATVEHVNLKRYMGTWYEIALLPNRFQKKCIEGAIAHYSLMDNGMVEVVNQCRTAKGLSTARGVAWVSDPTTQAKLKVSFVPFAKYFKWFGGDYWILYLDPEYKHGIVGDPSRKYLWFLSRTTSMPLETYQHLLQIAHEKGFDTQAIKKVR